jgi:hypothetical protein
MAEQGNTNSTSPSLWSPAIATGVAILAQCGAWLAMVQLTLAPTKTLPYVNFFIVVSAAGIASFGAVFRWVRYFQAYLQWLVQQRVQEMLAEVEQQRERALS